MLIIGSIFDFVLRHMLELAGGLSAAIALLIAYLTKKYLVPFLQVERHRRYARWIAAIADELTDDLRIRYPENKWIEKLDEAVDRIVEICGIKKQVAGRAIRAAVARKS
jgi:hypothetical protein